MALGIARMGLAAVSTMLNLGLGLLNKRTQAYLRATLIDRLEMQMTVRLPGGNELRFTCPDAGAVSRVQGFLTKEPATIAWLDSMASTDVLWDIGANIGLYSLYAARARGVRVIAFEPTIGNLLALDGNVRLNNLEEHISVFRVAAARQNEIGTLNVVSDGSGTSGHQFNRLIGQGGQPIIAVSKQSVLGMRIDDFAKVFAAQLPTHLKIDVDGLEDAVIDGARFLLDTPSLQSILIEISPGDSSIEAILMNKGFAIRRREKFNVIFDRVSLRHDVEPG